LHSEFPVYSWDKNKAYPTMKHRATIRSNGTTPFHRLTFDLLGDKKIESRLRIKAKADARALKESKPKDK